VKRGRKLSTGRFETRAELEEFVIREYKNTPRNQAQIARAARASTTTVANILKTPTKTMDKPITPKDLAFAGYRIEIGGQPDTDPPELHGRYWWTFHADDMGNVDTSNDDFATPEEAIEDAYQDLVLARGDDALSYFRIMDSHVDPADERRYVLEMIANEMRLQAANEVCRLLVSACIREKLSEDPYEFEWDEVYAIANRAKEALSEETIQQIEADIQASKKDV
jgi:hypothetical protein